MRKIFTIIFSLTGIFCMAQPCIPNSSSLTFNGTSSAISFSTDNGLVLDSAVTVEAWIYAQGWATISAQGSIFCKHSWTQGEQGYVLRAGGNGQLSFNFGGLDPGGNPTSWVEVLSANGALTLNTWYHVAGTFDGDTEKIYINGNLAGTMPFQGTIVPATAFPPKIGMLSDPGIAASRYWNGKIDEVRVWNRARSQAEILADMNHHIDPSLQTGLAGYWRFNETTGTIVNDLSPNANTGTVSNTSWTGLVPFNNAPFTPVILYNGTQLFSSAATSYQWYLNGTLLTNDTLQYYTPLVNGTYTVVTTNASGCTATSAPYVFTNVGMYEQNMNASVKVFPNPAQGIIYIESNIRFSNGVVKVYDAVGREILNTTLTGTEIQLNMSNFSPGIYSILVQNQDLNFTRKIILE